MAFARHAEGQREGGEIKAVISCRILNVETGALVYRETIFQTATRPTPPPGKMYSRLPSAREWALNRALYGLQFSLRAAFDPKLADGIILEMPDVYKGPGAKVHWVLMGSPADMAGVITGDVIMKVNGIPINSPLELRRAFDKETTVTVRRGTVEKEYVVRVDRP